MKKIVYAASLGSIQIMSTLRINHLSVVTLYAVGDLSIAEVV